MARQFGYRRVVCTSTGNHGVSLAAYAAAAGLECLVICARDPEPLAVRQMRLHGARVAVFEGSAEQLRAWVARLVAEEGWWPSTRNHPRPYANPFGPEGYKTIAFEIWRQLGRRVPSRVLVPTGGGDSIAGIAKGFRELRSLGLTDHLPVLVACQAAAAAPLVGAWEARAPTVSPVVAAPSIAVSIAEDSTGDHALRALVDGGLAVAVEEDRIAAAVALLGRDGFCVEPASAVSAAGLLSLASKGQVRRGETVVCIATASGIRWSATFAGVDGTPEVITPSALTRSG
jgi:threonine synthase